MSQAQKTHFTQPSSFKFTPGSMKDIDAHIAKYPEGRQASAVMPLLWIAQRQNGGWIPEKAMEEIARILDMPRIKVFEVATFYTMYKLAPVGRHNLQFCTTTPCWLRGSAEVVSACEKHLGIKLGGTTADGEFSMEEVECLGACVNGPVFQHNGDEFYEDISAENIVQVIEDMRAGKSACGSQTGRHKSMGPAGATCLHSVAKKAGIKLAEGGE